MGSTAIVIAVAYGIVTVLAVVVVLVIAGSTSPRRKPVDEERLAHRERSWFYVVIAIMLSLLFATIWFIPYGRSGTQGDVEVEVRASQFSWQVRPAVVPAGREIEFVLRSDDVNHGFGIYDPDGAFVAQAQVVPGKTQRLVRTFERTGHYEILCLEFCGYGHAAMRGEFTVVER